MRFFKLNYRTSELQFQLILFVLGRILPLAVLCLPASQKNFQSPIIDLVKINNLMFSNIFSSKIVGSENTAWSRFYLSLISLFFSIFVIILECLWHKQNIAFTMKWPSLIVKTWTKSILQGKKFDRIDSWSYCSLSSICS